MHNDVPKVSVIMSVYNDEHCVRSAINSIINQTFEDFEFIIVDDGSTDSTIEIIRQYTDERIRVISNERNIGLTNSLNKALKNAKGKYIARMDSDDISLPERFEQQVKFLDEHEDTYLISCSYREFGSRFGCNRITAGEDEIRAQYLFGSVLPHPGFMFRKKVFDKYHICYNPKMKYAQDYDFQVRVSRRFHIACLSQILLYYRVSQNQISQKKALEQKAYADKVRYAVFKNHGIPCNKEQIKLLSKVYYGSYVLTGVEYISFLKFFLSVYIAEYKNKSAESQYIIAKMLNYIRQLKWR